MTGLKVEIQFASDAGALPAADELEAWAQAAWRHPERGDRVCIRLVDEGEMTDLNGRYRSRPEATNVLSFEAGAVPGVPERPLGDLVICAPVVAREARQQGKAPAAHWAHMVVHGMLHLQGYDHEQAAEAADMEALEVAILAGLGHPDPYRADRAPDGGRQGSGGT